MEKLQGTGNQGQFVHENQDMASKQGFDNVSKLWYDKTMSYDEGFEQLESDRGHREDFEVALNDLQFGVDQVGSDVQFGMYIEDQFYVPTDHALTQIASKLCEGKGTGFVRGLRTDTYDAKENIKLKRDQRDAETVSAIIRNGARRIDGTTKYKIRTYDDGTVRAFLSNKYAEVDNRWFLSQIKNIIPSGRLSHWRGDADTIFGNVLIPDTIREEDDSDYGGMISVGNCEIGKRNVKSMPSLFRAICMNGCIWDQAKGTEIKVRHIGDIDLDQLSQKIRHNLEVQIPLLPQGIERVLGIRAMGTDGVPMKNLIAATADHHGLAKREATAVLESWVRYESPIAGEQRSLFDIVNSVTRAGQFLDNQSWFKFDQIGGQIAAYSDTKWTTIKSRAGDYEERDFKRVFANKPVLSA